MDSVQTAFDKVYWASEPPELQALPAIDDMSQRTLRAAALAAKGFIVDVPIMVWGWDPYLVMTMRANYGYTWVPSALQPNVTVAPGVTQPGTAAYDPTHPPAGSIKVSTNIADYPPFTPPASSPQLATDGDPVGVQSIGTLYLSVVGDTSPDGAKFTDSRGTFLKHVTITPFGRTNYWEKVG
jgi:hypothetical protein